MNAVDKAIATQLRNIETRTGKTLAALFSFLGESGLEKHGALRDLLKRELGMGHGDANTLVHVFRQQRGEAGEGPPRGSDASGMGHSASPAAGARGNTEGDVLDAIYTGAKAALRPIHDAVMAGIDGFGPFEIAPKKTYLSLRRRKQFATVGPATNTRVEIGLNMKGVAPTDRLIAIPPGGMCQYKVKLTSPADVDAELLAWIRTAYDAAS